MQRSLRQDTQESFIPRFSAAAADSLTGDFDLLFLPCKQDGNDFQKPPCRKTSFRVDLNTSLKDLPIFSKITTGTFTISGKTFSIDNLNMSLKDVMDKVNAAMSGGVSGVNPESDETGVPSNTIR